MTRRDPDHGTADGRGADGALPPRLRLQERLVTALMHWRRGGPRPLLAALPAAAAPKLPSEPFCFDATAYLILEEVSPSALHGLGPLGLARPEDPAVNPDSLIEVATAPLTKGATLPLPREVGLRRRLPAAPRIDALALHYQPQVSLAEARAGDRAGDRIVGLEALARMPLGDGRWAVPEAYTRGLAGRDLAPIDDWAMRTGLAQLAAWRAEGIDDIGLAINLPLDAVDDPACADMVLARLEESGLPPEYVELELTEARPVASLDHAAAALTRLRRVGLKLALDDFGSGFANLTLLDALPLDRVKIDRLYLEGLTSRPAAKAGYGAMVALLKAKGLEVLAEGVEHPTERDCLKALGCDLYQGFCFSPPLPEAACSLLLRGRERPPSTPRGLP